MNVSGERTQSLWMAQTAVFSGARRLTKLQQADVVVIGSGIAGLSVAYELTLLGKNVMVIDRGLIGKGMTARTTAHLSAISDDFYHAFISRRGEASARLFHDSHAAAIARIGDIAATEHIDCQFRRVDGYLFEGGADGEKLLERELEASRQLDIAVEKVSGLPFAGSERVRALRFPQQGTFSPLHYLQGLVRAILARGGKLFANSMVTAVEERDSQVVVQLRDGIEVEAGAAVVATNSPINDLVAIHTKQAPYRTYALALDVPRGGLPDALFWDTLDPYHYVRIEPGDQFTDHLIVGGEDHKSGGANDGEERLHRLESWTRNLVPQAGRVTHRWSGQVLEPVDFSGFIGRNPGNKNIYIVTGDSGQGMTHGALSGPLIAGLIQFGSHPWEALYDPSRKTLSAAGEYVSENLTAVKNFAEYVAPGEVSSTREIKRGEGAIVRQGLHKVAAYRDDKGKLYKRSAMCTHAGCHVHWNALERCWDCPCHGSQFAPDGEALNGPAVNPLPPAKT